jgi:uncharacterized membrane protein
MIDLALDRLDATPAQERAIVAELDQLEHRLHEASRTLREQRGPLAEALRGPSLDEDSLASVMVAFDQASGEARSAVIDALMRVHALLDDGQRERLASMLGRAPRGGGPYRT